MATKKETAGKTAKKEENNNTANPKCEIDSKAFAVPREVGHYIETLKNELRMAATVLSILNGALKEKEREEAITRQLIKLVDGLIRHIMRDHGIGYLEIVGLTAMIAKDLMPTIIEDVEKEMKEEAKASKADAKKPEKKGGK